MSFILLLVNGCDTYVQTYNNSLSLFFNMYSSQEAYDRAVYKVVRIKTVYKYDLLILCISY
jgi:hypothetical protein